MRRTRNKLLRARRAGGFTLAEVMLALGILGFALPMVAAALLAGVLETQESFDNTMSTMLEENALAVLRCRVTHSDLMSKWGPGQMASFQQLPDGLIHDDDLVYSPFDDPELRTKFACVIMGRRMAPNANDYLFVVMAYRKLRDNDDVVAVQFDPAAPNVTTQTYVRLQSSVGPDQSAMVNYLLVRMALKPEKPSPDGM